MSSTIFLDFNVFSKFKSTSKKVNLQFVFHPTFLVYEKKVIQGGPKKSL